MRAAQLYRRAATLGDPVAMLLLAGCYREGSGGVEKEDVTAFGFLHRGGSHEQRGGPDKVKSTLARATTAASAWRKTIRWRSIGMEKPPTKVSARR